ncbi:MAG: hypothetical protein SFX74_00305 [Fimbriimonadaceae bacterium]|nr:hypothetical protein [Fimbriimonadaceae bacterium]
MRYQDQLVRQTQGALDDICRAALAVPEDRWDWSPGGAARSVLSQMQEIATSAALFLPVVREGEFAPLDHIRAESARAREEFGSVERCIVGARSSTSELCALIAAFPDDRLDVEIVVPFGGGSTWTMADVLGKHYWNLVYHHGQINQLQLILGDRAMH